MFDDDFELPDGLDDMADMAAAALANMGEEYAQDASKDADRLLKCAEAVHQIQEEAPWQEAIEEVFSLAHNFKGQGQTFGYDLVTTIGEELCEISRPKNNPKREDVPRIMQLSAALHTVLHQRLTGDGGETGARLCTELGIAI